MKKKIIQKQHHLVKEIYQYHWGRRCWTREPRNTYSCTMRKHPSPYPLKPYERIYLKQYIFPSRWIEEIYKTHIYAKIMNSKIILPPRIEKWELRTSGHRKRPGQELVSLPHWGKSLFYPSPCLHDVCQEIKNLKIILPPCIEKWELGTSGHRVKTQTGAGVTPTLG